MDADSKEPKYSLDTLWNTYKKYELELIKQALSETNQDKAKAARLLGIPRTRLIEKMRRIPELKHLIKRATYCQYRATAAAHEKRRLENLQSQEPSISDRESEQW